MRNDKKIEDFLMMINCLKELSSLRKELTEQNDESMVENPKHYQSEQEIDAIQVIESFKLNFNLGNAVKYILRCGKKGDPLEDIQKAIWYLKREKLNLTEEKDCEV